MYKRLSSHLQSFEIPDFPDAFRETARTVESVLTHARTSYHTSSAASDEQRVASDLRASWGGAGNRNSVAGDKPAESAAYGRSSDVKGNFSKAKNRHSLSCDGQSIVSMRETINIEPQLNVKLRRKLSNVAESCKKLPPSNSGLVSPISSCKQKAGEMLLHPEVGKRLSQPNPIVPVSPNLSIRRKETSNIERSVSVDESNLKRRERFSASRSLCHSDLLSSDEAPIEGDQDVQYGDHDVQTAFLKDDFAAVLKLEDPDLQDPVGDEDLSNLLAGKDRCDAEVYNRDSVVVGEEDVRAAIKLEYLSDDEYDSLM